MTPAKEIRAAAKRIRTELPPHWRHAPRLVQTDSESIDGVAFCPQTHETSGEYEFADCDWCEVIETHHEKLADLIVALLSAREPLAAWLESAAEDSEVIGTDHRALAVARVINGGAS